MSSDAYQAAPDAWKSNGGPRPHLRPDGIPTRIDSYWKTNAEKSIDAAMVEVEKLGGSPALTDAVTLLSKARDLVADHVEEYEIDNPLTDAERAEAIATGHADLLIDVGPCGMAYRAKVEELRVVLTGLAAVKEMERRALDNAGALLRKGDASYAEPTEFQVAQSLAWAAQYGSEQCLIIARAYTAKMAKLKVIEASLAEIMALGRKMIEAEDTDRQANTGTPELDARVMKLRSLMIEAREEVLDIVRTKVRAKVEGEGT